MAANVCWFNTATTLSTLLCWQKGEVEKILEATAEFLQSLQPQAAVKNQAWSFGTVVNRTYLDAALTFRPQVDINSIVKSKSLVSGRVLEYSWADSGCSAKQGLKAMGKLLQGESRIDAVIGPGCSSACEVTGYLSGGQGIPQISYSCTSPTLSNKNEYGLVHCRNN